MMGKENQALAFVYSQHFCSQNLLSNWVMENKNDAKRPGFQFNEAKFIFKDGVCWRVMDK